MFRHSHSRHHYCLHMITLNTQVYPCLLGINIMPTDCNFQTKLEKERVSLAEFFSVLEGYKSDARGIIPTSYHNIINICYFMKTLLHRVNTWKSAKNIPPLFYFQEQRIGDLPSRTTRFYENTSSRRAMKQKMNT